MSEPLEMDLSGLEMWSDRPAASNDLAAQLVASIQEELVTTVVSELVASMNSLTERVEADQARQDRFTDMMERVLAEAQADRASLVAALEQVAAALSAQADPVVNVNVPEPVVTVNVPKAAAPIVNVAPPEVNVTLPSSSRTVTVKRDPLSGLIASADVVEV